MRAGGLFKSSSVKRQKIATRMVLFATWDREYNLSLSTTLFSIFNIFSRVYTCICVCVCVCEYESESRVSCEQLCEERVCVGDYSSYKHFLRASERERWIKFDIWKIILKKYTHKHSRVYMLLVVVVTARRHSRRHRSSVCFRVWRTQCKFFVLFFFLFFHAF